MQSRRASVIEAATSTGIGMLVNLIANYVVLPRFGMRVSLVDNVALTGIYTVVSFLR